MNSFDNFMKQKSSEAVSLSYLVGEHAENPELFQVFLEQYAEKVESGLLFEEIRIQEQAAARWK